MAANEKVINLVIRAQDQYSRVLKNAEGAISALAKRQQAKLDLTADIRRAERDFKTASEEAKQYAIALKAAQAAGEGSASATRQLAANLVLARGRAQEAKAATAAYSAELRAMRTGAQGSFKQFSQSADAMDVTAATTERLKKQLADLNRVYQEATAAAGRYNVAQRAAPGLTNGRNAASEIEKARAAKIEIVETQAALTRLNGSAQSSFLAFSRAADGMQLAATEALELAPATQQVVSASNRVIAAQKAQKIAMDATTASMRRQTNTRAPGGGFNQGVKGEKQEVALFGLKPYALTNLAYQANDVISGLAMGQRPMQVLAQQLGQILQIFPSFTRLFFTAVPVISAFAVVLGPVAVNLAAINREAENTETFRKQLALLADGANYTAEGLGKIASNVGDLQIVSDLVKRGFRQDQIQKFSEAASAMAAVTGQEVPDAVAALADAFSGGYDELRKFDSSAKVFTASELELIKSLYDAGKAAEAQEVAFDALNRKLAAGATDAAGPWARAMANLGGAWQSFLNLFKDSVIQDIVTGSLRILADTIARIGKGLTVIIDSVNSAADGFRLSLDQQITKLQDLIAQEKQVIADAQSAGMTLGPDAFVDLEGMEKRLTQLKNQKAIEEQIAAIEATPRAAGLTNDFGSEEYNKRVLDLQQAMAKVNAERQASTALLGQEGRLAAEAVARQEAEALAKEKNVSLNDEKVKAEIEGFVQTALAAYDAKEATDAFAEAEQKATRFIEDQTKAQEDWRAVVEDMKDIRAELVAKYGQEAAAVKQLDAAMAKFTSEMQVAEGQANSLAYAASNLAQALASLGNFDADLTTRLATAERKIQMAQAGYSKARIEAEAEVNAQTREANRVLVEEGRYTFDQVAAMQAERVAQLEKVKTAEERAQEVMQETFNPKKGGGGAGKSEAELREERVNQLLDYRAALLERLQYYQANGNTQMVDNLKTMLEGVNVELTQAVDGMIALLNTMTGPEAQTMLLEMMKLREEIAQGSRELASTLPDAAEINDQLATTGVDALDALAEAIANGEDVAKSFFDALRTGFAELLLNIAKAIMQYTILRALQGGDTTGGGVGGWLSKIIKASVMHKGGIVGGGGASRAVNPAIFANAMRYHTGGVAGLKPNEVPAILEKGERVLTAEQQKAGAASPTLNAKIVNVIDPADVVAKAMATEEGQQVIINFMSKNQRMIRNLLSG